MSRIGFDLGYPTVADALAGGEAGMFAELAAFGDPSLLVKVSYLSAPLDITVLGAAVQLAPALPGYYALRVGYQSIVKTTAGALVGLASSKAGNNGARDNWFSSAANTPASATQIAAGALAAGQATTLIPAAKVLADMTAAPFLEITLGASGTGGFACTLRILTELCLFPVAAF